MTPGTPPKEAAAQPQAVPEPEKNSRSRGDAAADVPAVTGEKPEAAAPACETGAVPCQDATVAEPTPGGMATPLPQLETAATKAWRLVYSMVRSADSVLRCPLHVRCAVKCPATPAPVFPKSPLSATFGAGQSDASDQ